MPTEPAGDITASAERYARLRRQVAEAMVRGRQEIEALKVKIYWQTGDIIRGYLDQSRVPESGASAVLDDLSGDLGVERTLFYRVLKFRDLYPGGVATEQQLTWSHYKALLAVEDPKLRARFSEKAGRTGLAVRGLREMIAREKNPRQKPAAPAPLDAIPVLVEPPKGTPGIYRIRETALETGAVRKVVDLGFNICLALPEQESARFQPGASVIWDAASNAWAPSKEKYDYFFTAALERTVDGDTLLLRIDVFRDITLRQYVRLRGVNAPELKTPAGERSFQWLKNKLAGAPTLEVRTSTFDPYGRYIADIWTPDGGYINQALLDAGQAVSVRY